MSEERSHWEYPPPSRTFQIWEGGGGMVLLNAARLEEQRHSLGNDPEMILEFQADSWEEACQVFHDHYGWGTYEP